MSKEREKKRQLKEQLRQTIAKNYKDTIVELQGANSVLTEENRILKSELETVKSENKQLKDYIEHIKKVTELSKEELDTLVQTSKDRAEVAKVLGNFMNIGGILDETLHS